MTDILNKISNYLENLALIPEYAEFFYNKYFEIMEKSKGILFFGIVIILAFFIFFIAILANQNRLEKQIAELSARLEDQSEEEESTKEGKR